MQIAGRLKDRVKAAATGLGEKIKATPYGQGFTAATAQMEKAGDYSHSIIPGLGGSMDFYKDMAAQGVSPKQPIKFAGALGGHDAGQPGNRNHIAFFERAVEDQLQGLRPHQDAAPRRGSPVGHVLVGDVDHPRFAVIADMRQSGHYSAARVWC